MNRYSALVCALSFVLASLVWAKPASAAVITSDIVIVMDESGSTGNGSAPTNGYSNLLQANVFGYLSAFDEVLSGRGIQANFALVGFGGANSMVNLITESFTTATDVAEQARRLLAYGESKGVYTAISVAFDSLNFSAAAVKNFILFTDEPARDPATTLQQAEQQLQSNAAALNSVVAGGSDSDLGQLALRTGGDYFDIEAFKSAGDEQAQLLMRQLAGVKANEIIKAYCVGNPTAAQCAADNSHVTGPAGLGLLITGLLMLHVRTRSAAARV